ncbi:MAG: ABC transporter ATP-binding protein, partial [Pyramidobacter sp.]|nr:ABC transporter ATP-binding protein [Pyramidobacter sp.]
IKKDGKEVKIQNPNDANDLGIGMVHQHFKLIEVFTVLDNIILGAETTKLGFLQKKEARKKVQALSERYGLKVDLDAKVEDITVGMQQRVEILKMLYRDNEILIFDEPTAVLTPQEIAELMQIMKNLTKEGKSILFISHKLNEIMEVSDRVSVLRKGRYIGTVNTADTDKQSLSNMMVGRPVQLEVQKTPAQPKEPVLHVEHLCVASHLHKKDAVHDVSFDVHAGEILCIAGIDGNGQTELIYGLSGLDKPTSGKVELCGKDITHSSIHKRLDDLSHIPEDRHKHGLVLDFTLEQNMVLQRYRDKQFQSHSFIRNDEVRKYAEDLIEEFDVRSGQGPITVARSMSGGNQQKAIIARELDREKPLVIAVQPTRGLDVGAIEFIHAQLVAQRDAGKAVLLVSLELDEVMSLSDRILVRYEGEIVGELDPKKTTVAELGLYMAGAKRDQEGGADK